MNRGANAATLVSSPLVPTRQGLDGDPSPSATSVVASDLVVFANETPQ